MCKVFTSISQRPDSTRSSLEHHVLVLCRFSYRPSSLLLRQRRYPPEAPVDLRDDKKNGKGMMRYKDGRVESGRWEDSMFKGSAEGDLNTSHST